MVHKFLVAAFDLDGTLLNSAGGISGTVAASLVHARRIGLELVIVTARSPFEITGIHGIETYFSTAICCSGGTRYDFSRRRPVLSRLLSAESTKRIFDELRIYSPNIRVGWIDMDGIHYEEGYPMVSDEGFLEQVGSSPQKSVLKAFAKYVGDISLPFHKIVEGILNEEAEIGHRGRQFADFVAPGVDKLSALQEWCDEIGCTAESVIAFGDSTSDTPVLRWAGHGVAMGNSAPDVQQAANSITASCDDDGVAHAIMKLLP